MTEITPAAAAPARPRRFAREITTLVLAPGLIWIVGWAPPSIYVALIAMISGLALFEFLLLGDHKGYPTRKTLSIVLLFVLLGSFANSAVSVEIGVFLVLLALPAAYVFSRSDLSHALPACAVSVLGVLYVGMLGGALLRLRLEFAAGPKLVLFLLIVVWAGDAGAYYIGRAFGRTPLSPRVSPKKTVEGGIGGLVTSVLAAAAIHSTFFPAFPLRHALLAALLLSAAGIVGDLAESMWKRSAEVKDSGGLIPGHGGFLDRFDSVLFTAPILYTYWFILQHGLIARPA